VDTHAAFRKIIERVLCEYVDFVSPYGQIQTVPVFDRTRDHYLLLAVGWDSKGDYVHGCVVHIELVGDKCWVQYDGTEDGITYDLERAGIPKEQIVLGFQPPYIRPHTGYAVA
jgi:XisI protein